METRYSFAGGGGGRNSEGPPSARPLYRGICNLPGNTARWLVQLVWFGWLVARWID